MQHELKVECGSCRGTGIYRGFAEPSGVGVICVNCDGTGQETLKYTPFEGRKTRNDISIVRYSRGSLIATGIGPVGGSISYQEFLNGKMPKKS